MNWIVQQFSYPEHSLLVHGSYDPMLVTLSVLIAIFASSMALQINSHSSQFTRASARLISTSVGAVALGGGVWSMHFIGMLAFHLHTPVEYRWDLTVFSMVPSIAASMVALRLIAQSNITARQLLAGGVLVGSGIGTMHYTGMAAMDMGPLLRYDPWYFALSIVVAVSLAMLSLWIRYGLGNYFNLRIRPWGLNLLGGTVMGIAIASMHYVGMAAARFVSPQTVTIETTIASQPILLALGITLTTMLITFLVVATNLTLKYRDISQVAQASETRLRAMMETAADGIITINAAGIIVSANESAESIFGWGNSELTGQNVSVIMPQPFAGEHDGYIRRYLDSGHERIIGRGREVQGWHRLGHPVPVRLAVGCVKLPDEILFVGFVSDISERLKIEQALKDNEARFRTLISNIPGAAYRRMNDSRWHMLFVSEAVESITGYPASDFSMPDPVRSFADLLHPDDRQQATGNAALQSCTAEYRIIRKDGAVRWILDNGHWIRDDNGAVKWLDGFLMDITPRKEMEVQVLQARDKAEHAAQTRSAFLANMSHEIRTPMNAIIGFGDVLLESDLPAEQHKYLMNISKASKSLLHLLNDILNIAKLEQGKVELELANFSIHELVDTVISTLWLQARQKDLALNIVLHPDLESCYYGAPDRLQQVLTNLVGNAIKFTEHGSVTFCAEPGNDDFVLFSIRDTGIGIAADRLDSIFEPFTQADASMTRRFGGTGLGTSISKQLVELMGGTIEVSSTPGQGSCFAFGLPLPRGTSTPIMNPVPGNWTLPALDVLVADDIQQNLDLLQLQLEKAGHRVTCVMNGIQAVEQLQKRRFDIILMDVQMPELDGLAAAREIHIAQRASAVALTPIVALTASVHAEDRMAAYEAGMTGFASKPLDFRKLCAEMARVLNIELQEEPAAVTPRTAARGAPGAQVPEAVDHARAIELWQSWPRYLNELSRFASRNRSAARKLEMLLHAGDYMSLSRQSHALAGASGNLALPVLANTFAALEQAAKKQSLRQCQALLEPLPGQLTALDIVLAESAGTIVDAAPHDTAYRTPGELLSRVEHLISLTSRHELDEAALSQLVSEISDRHPEVIAASLALDEFDFARSLSSLTSLRQKLLEEESAC